VATDGRRAVERAAGSATALIKVKSLAARAA
jgi:hypothetical protein